MSTQEYSSCSLPFPDGSNCQKTKVLARRSRKKRQMYVVVVGAMGATLITASAAQGFSLGKVGGLISFGSGILNQVGQFIPEVSKVLGSEFGAELTEFSNGLKTAQKYLAQANKYLQAGQFIFSSLSSGNLKGIVSGAEQFIGAIGLPDPDELGQDAADSAWSETIPPGGFSCDPQIPASDGGCNDGSEGMSGAAAAQAAVYSVNRGYGRVVAASVLSKAGQAILKAQQDYEVNLIKASGSANQEVAQLAQEAESQTITQEVMKRIAAQNTQISGQLTINAELARQQSQQLTGVLAQAATTNYLLADVSAQQDQQNQIIYNKDQDVNAMLANANALVFIPSAGNEQSSSPSTPPSPPSSSPVESELPIVSLLKQRPVSPSIQQPVTQFTNQSIGLFSWQGGQTNFNLPNSSTNNTTNGN
jgi:hypothetical protein